MRFFLLVLTLLLAGGVRDSAAPAEETSASGRTAQASRSRAFPDSTDAEAAAEVVRAYYAAIDAGNYRGAYDRWGAGGIFTTPTLLPWNRRGYTVSCGLRGPS